MISSRGLYYVFGRYPSKLHIRDWRISLGAHCPYLLAGLMERLGTKQCKVCGARGATVSAQLGVCAACLRNSWREAQPLIKEAHGAARDPFGLPTEPPAEGAPCGLCVHMCRLEEGQVGFCGVREGTRGGAAPRAPGAVVKFYYDPLPTNCVADFVCPGGTACGYPRFSVRPGPEYGYKNLAVFYGACNFSCLFCQNWQFRSMTQRLGPAMTAEELAGRVDDTTTCICYFGGDPTPQMEHALTTSEIAVRRQRPLRVCFETNGSASRRYVREMARVSYESGGCIKFDLKAWDERIHHALCFASNKLTLRNFKWLAEYHAERGDRGVPFLVASTLLVPGYVEEDEVRSIALYVAELDPEIPYSILAFAPHFMMRDMPLVSRELAQRCLEAARESGLKRVRLGNAHMVS